MKLIRHAGEQWATTPVINPRHVINGLHAKLRIGIHVSHCLQIVVQNCHYRSCRPGGSLCAWTLRMEAHQKNRKRSGTTPGRRKSRMSGFSLQRPRFGGVFFFRPTTRFCSWAGRITARLGGASVTRACRRRYRRARSNLPDSSPGIADGRPPRSRRPGLRRFPW